jgi:TPR repeat protein
MGLLCEAGQGVEQDLNEAQRWFRLAAEQDYAAARDRLKA